MGRSVWLLLSLGLSVFSAPCALAYVPTITPSGVPIRWKGQVQLNFVGNPINQSGLDHETFFNSVVIGLQRWKQASSGEIHFDYWQGNDAVSFPPNSDYNGTSSIYFASNANGETHLSPNVLGMTQVWYNTDTGEILETDIVLNDKDFHFTNEPQDTTGYGAKISTFTDGKSNVFVQNVVTHELGHALGLSHSGGLQSTMLFMESPEQAHLACDELTAIHFLYPTSDASQRGNLEGILLSETGTPIFGAHVLAISRKRGTVIATALTDKAGKYFIGSLEPGDYFMLAEPFYAGPQALPAYFADSSSTHCTQGTSFSRTFLTESNDFDLIKIPVNSSQTTHVPAIRAHCDGSGGAAVTENPLSILLLTAPAVTPISLEDGSFGLVDKFGSTHTHYYKLPHLSGHLELHTLAYSLYSPIHSSISLIDPQGKPVPAHISDPVYSGDSGYLNQDSALIADDLTLGDYILKVTANPLQANNYPAGPVSLDSTPFIVLTGSLDSDDPILINSLPNNARCKASEDFPPYQSPTLPPPHTSMGQPLKGGGFCGMIQNDGRGTRGSTSLSSLGARADLSATPGAIMGWLLPWLLMLLTARAATYLHRSLPPVNLKRWESEKSPF